MFGCMHWFLKSVLCNAAALKPSLEPTIPLEIGVHLHICREEGDSSEIITEIPRDGLAVKSE